MMRIDKIPIAMIAGNRTRIPLREILIKRKVGMLSALFGFLLLAASAHAATKKRTIDSLYQIYSSTSMPSSYKEQAWRRLHALDPMAKLARPQRDATVPRSTATVSGIFYRSRGGQLHRQDNAGLSVPPGALANDGLLMLSEQSLRSDLERSVMARKLGTAGLGSVSTGVEVGPGSVAFSVPATLVVPYDPLLVGTQSIVESALQVYRWNRDKEQWDWLPSTVNGQNHTVSAQVSRASFYMVAGRLPPPAP